MSDGMTEAYRAGRAYRNYEELMKEAVAEHILLIDEKKQMSKLEKIEFLIENCKSIEIKPCKRYKVDTEYGIRYYSNIRSSDKDKYPYVDFFELEISFGEGIHKKFDGPDFEEVLGEAIAYGAILQTPKGRLAVEAYNRYYNRY